MKPRDQQVTIDELFEKNYVHGDNGCWNWQGSFNNLKVPIIIHNKSILDLRKWSYNTFVNPVPKKHFVYQECRNRKCLQPEPGGQGRNNNEFHPGKWSGCYYYYRWNIIT